MSSGWLTINLLWASALAAIPLAMLVGATCRWLPMRPSTRHGLWCTLLVLLAALPLIIQLPRPPDGLAAAVGRELGQLMPSRSIAEPAEQANATTPPARAAAGQAIPRPGGADPGVPLAVASDLPQPAARAEAPTFADSRSVAPMVVPARPPGQADRPMTTSRDLPVKPAPGRLDTATSAEDVTASSGGGAAGPWLAWRHQLGEMWALLLAAPIVPAQVWAAGIAFLLLVMLLRIALASSVLRRAVPAPEAVTAMVAEEAAALGLARVPEVFMVDRRITPMIWCGTRVRLLLPQRLWQTLHSQEQRAIVLHELAHVRRRDHWVCWGQMLMGCIYWWHPVMWWIHRRIREEADLCCDAWVTALRPRSRRAYAQALLDTRRYLSDSNLATAAPAVGLGVNSVRAKRFARRLTMVMTEQRAPRISLRGVALVLALGAAAYLVAPAFACPPAKKSKAKKAERLPTPVLALPTPAVAPVAPMAPEPATTYERYMRDRDSTQPAERGEDRHMERLERRLHELLQKLEQLQDGQSRRPAPPAPPSLPAPPSHSAPPSPGILAATDDPSARARDVYFTAVAGDRTEARAYRLSDGKLEMLTELMVRSDVPIRVKRTGDALEVHATPRQHLVFETFCKMIDGEQRVETYELSEGKLRELTKLMSRSDVPILIESGDTSIKVHGSDLEQMVFAAFVRMIDPANTQVPTAEAVSEYRTAVAPRNDAARRELEMVLVELVSQIEALQMQEEVLLDEAEELADAAEDLQDDAEDLRDAAEDADGPTRSRLVAEAKALAAQAKQLDRQARKLEKEAESVEREADNLKKEVKKVRLRIQKMEKQGESGKSLR